MKKLYGIDLDGICFHFAPAFCKWLEDKTGLKMPEREEITSYYWHKCIDGLEEDVFWEEFHKFGQEGHGYLNLPMVEGALDGLNNIVSSGHEIVYITNRPEYTLEDTKEALLVWDFPFRDRLIFGSPASDGGSKSPIINEHNVDVFIDDSPRVIADISVNTNARIYCFDYPFNQHIDGRFTRVSSWEEFLTAEGIYEASAATN